MKKTSCCSENSCLDKNILAERSFKIISGESSSAFSSKIAESLGVNLVDIESRRFANGERYVRICDTVRKSDVFIIQNASDDKEVSLNDRIMEVLLLVDAARRASAGEIVVALPFMPYSRQDRKAREREPISIALILKMLKTAGVDRVLAMDLHSLQAQGAFDGPFDHISAHSLLIKQLKSIIGKNNSQYVVVAPDAGSVKKSSYCAVELGVDLVYLPKMRDKDDSSKISRPLAVDGVNGKKCIIIDDMVDTGGTLISAAEMLKLAGAKQIVCAATHGLLSMDACERIKNSSIDKIILTDTLPQDEHKKILNDRLEVVSVASIFAEAIRRIERGESLCDLD